MTHAASNQELGQRIERLVQEQIEAIHRSAREALGETISEYYRQRRSPDELLVAYAQNWMGENFYTGNHVATFKVPGTRFKSWVEQRRQAGALSFFVTTEHKTIPRLRQELSNIQTFEVLTTPGTNNKFALARVTL